MQAPLQLWVQCHRYHTAFTRPHFVSRLGWRGRYFLIHFVDGEIQAQKEKKWFAKGKSQETRSRAYISEHTLHWKKTRQHFTICLGELWWWLTVATGNRTMVGVCKELSGPNKIQLDSIVTWRQNLLICVCTAKLYRGDCDMQLRPKRKYWHMAMQTLGFFLASYIITMGVSSYPRNWFSTESLYKCLLDWRINP